MIFKKLLTFFIAFSAFEFVYGGQDQSKDHLVYFGGGSSNQEADSMFDSSFKDWLQYSKGRFGDREFYYRRKLPDSLPENTGKDVRPISAQAFNNKIKSLVNDITNGKIRSGEKLLLVLDTHGGIDSGKYRVTTDEDTAAVDLQDLIKVAEQKHVKLGIVGDTCYSGQLLKYSSSSACIITLTKPDRVGWKNDSDMFSFYLKNSAGHTNLEDAYLTSRVGTVAISQPMISTEVGKQVDQILNLLKPMIVASVDLENDLKRPSCPNLLFGFDRLEKNIRDLKIPLSLVVGDSLDLTANEIYKRLKDTAVKYQTLRDEVPAIEAELAYLRGKPITVGDESVNVESVDSILQEIDKERPSCFKEDPCKGLSSEQVLMDNKCHVVSCEFLNQRAAFARNAQQSPEYQRYKELRQQPRAKELENLSQTIATKERELYNALYMKLSEKNKGSNPCRDFKM